MPNRTASRASQRSHPAVPPTETRRADRATIVGVSVALFVVTVGVYLRTMSHQFINYDDPSYVTANLHVRNGFTADTLRWALTATEAMNWHPLTWMSHAFDYQLFGLQAYGHHLTSVVLHGLNTVLLFIVLTRMTAQLWPSAFTAALFALHPLHVESVAWVAERKDVLSGFFWMLTLMAYVWYVQNPTRGRWWSVAVIYALGLMSKPMLVTLPFVLLLLDYWPLKRMGLDAALAADKSRQPLSRLVIEKIPLFVLAVISSTITFVVQRAAGAVAGLDTIPLALRISTAIASYVAYLRKMLWPVDLAFFYPYSYHPSAVTVAGALVVVAVMSMLAIWQRVRRPYLLVGWLWYLGTLVPVLGIVQVGGQALADRYTYIPLIGVFVLVAWGGRELFARNLMLGVCLGIATLGAYGALTWQQLGYWRDSETLLTHALEVTRNNDVAHLNLGVELEKQGRSQQARGHFTEALRIRPEYAAAHNNLGISLASEGDLHAAIQHYRDALHLAPQYVDARCNLASALAVQGKTDEAKDEYVTALRIAPDDAQARNSLGLLLLREGDREGAIRHFEHALKSNPEYLQAHVNLGMALRALGDLDGAIVHYRRAVEIDPTSAVAHNNLGNALAQQRRFDEAVTHYLAASRIDPSHPDVQYNWGNTMAEQGKFEDAIEHYREALRINPANVDAQRNMSRAETALNQSH